MQRKEYIELDLAQIEKYGKARENENLQFRSFLKGQDADKIDKIVHQINHRISSQIDCTTCGNCCSKLPPSISDQDVEKLSNCLRITPDQIRKDYLKDIEGEHFFKMCPCSFLKNKKCSIYNDRPEDCRSYPYLHKRNFTHRLWGVIENYSVCPIVFNVFEELKCKLGFR